MLDARFVEFPRQSRTFFFPERQLGSYSILGRQASSAIHPSPGAVSIQYERGGRSESSSRRVRSPHEAGAGLGRCPRRRERRPPITTIPGFGCELRRPNEGRSSRSGSASMIGAGNRAGSIGKAADLRAKVTPGENPSGPGRLGLRLIQVVSAVGGRNRLSGGLSREIRSLLRGASALGMLLDTGGRAPTLTKWVLCRPGKGALHRFWPAAACVGHSAGSAGGAKKTFQRRDIRPPALMKPASLKSGGRGWRFIRACFSWTKATHRETGTWLVVLPSNASGEVAA